MEQPPKDGHQRAQRGVLTMSRFGRIGALGVLAVAVASGWAGAAWGAARAKTERNMTAAGQRLYVADCQTCHGPGGNGAGGAPPLDTRGVFLDHPTSENLARFIRQQMPASDPKSLSPAEARDLVRYLASIRSPQGRRLLKSP